jgi:hypothetical protein
MHGLLGQSEQNQESKFTASHAETHAHRSAEGSETCLVFVVMVMVTVFVLIQRYIGGRINKYVIKYIR